MSSNEQKNFNYNGQKSIVVDGDSKPSKRPYLIGFIVFLVLTVGLVLFALWWFVWRDSNSPLVRLCTRNTQCAPNEICNSDTGQCNAVSCTINSQCTGIANGTAGGSCVNGWCQTAACSSNSDCSNLGDNYACSNIPLDPNSATPWLTTACVQTGDGCTADTDCFGGNYGLVCSKSDGSSNGVCVQCAGNTDCTGRNAGLVCDTSVNLCTACTDDSQCGGDNVCGNGTCCSNPLYMVNGSPSCNPGELFDICTTDTDCKTGTRCINLGSDPKNPGSDELKVCGGGSGGDFIFSAGVRVDSGVGDPDRIASVTCTAPGGPNDYNSLPFAVNGGCTVYSANADGSDGSACGKPSYCRDTAAHGKNILCNGQITFENPFVTSCTSIDQCVGATQGCGNDNICGQACNKATDGNSKCPAGTVCITQSNTAKLPSGFTGVCQYPTSQISCTTSACSDATKCPCPSSYGCDGKSNKCVWSGNTSPDPNNPDTPPPPLVIESVCSRPATALPQSSTAGEQQVNTTNYIPSYCVSGFCNTTPGWINSVCVGDGDCMYLGNDGDSKVRLGLNCTARNGVNICQ